MPPLLHNSLILKAKKIFVLNIMTFVMNKGQSLWKSQNDIWIILKLKEDILVLTTMSQFLKDEII